MQVRGLFSVGLNGEYTETGGVTDTLILQMLVKPEFFPGPGTTYTCLVSWYNNGSTTPRAAIYYGGTLQDIVTNPTSDGDLQATVTAGGAVANTTVTLTLTGVPKPTTTTLWKLAMRNAAIVGLRATIK